MYVIGTAGHVDHGKSTLVQALTGTNPDRLKEERERQMTIDLGFAWLTLPNGQSVGVVDVPGHHDFIANMLAGVGGIDAALFVIAADEGAMPQTREHLAILDLLRIPGGVIALTKSDLVDVDWLHLMQAEVTSLLRGTVLADAPLVPVSARTGAGLADLREHLQGVLLNSPRRLDTGQPLLPIDRVFTLSGFGTIVTGTLAGGQLSVGAEVLVQPGAVSARVRGLQTHKSRLDTAAPGSRVAVNLAGVEVNRLRRGQVLTLPGGPLPTPFIDVHLEYLDSASLDLQHNAVVKLFIGAAEVVGTVRLLDSDHLRPGAAGWAQLALAAPVVAVKGQRFILRRPSPPETIAGGTVVDPHPPRRHRRFQPTVIARLETLARGTPNELLIQAFQSLGPATLAEAVHLAGLEPAEAASVCATLKMEAQLVSLEDDLLVSHAGWTALVDSLTGVLGQYHASQPLRSGMPREELKNRLAAEQPPPRRARWTARVFNAFLEKAVQTGHISLSGALVRLSGHRVRFSDDQQTMVGALLTAFQRDPVNTPSHKDCAARVGDAVLAALVDQGTLVMVSADVLFLPETYATLVERLRAYLAEHGSITVADARDLFGTSRKYVLALLEHLDEQGITRRVGDQRVLRSA